MRVGKRVEKIFVKPEKFPLVDYDMVTAMR